MTCGTTHSDSTYWAKACKGIGGVVTVIHPTTEAHLTGWPNDDQDGDSFAYNINSSGHIFGYYLDPNDTYFAKPFFYNGSTTVALPVLPGESSVPNAMNDNDVIVGGAWNGSDFVPFKWSPSAGLSYIPLLPGQTGGRAFSVNNLNWIVGENSPGNLAFIYMGGVTTALIDIAASFDPLWTSIVTARFSNNSKQVCGFGIHNGVQKAYRLTFV
jgi:hypothetical protein